MRKAQQQERVSRAQPSGPRPQQHRASQAGSSAKDTSTHRAPVGFVCQGNCGTCSCVPTEQNLTPDSPELLAEALTGVKHSGQAKRESVFLLQGKVQRELPLSNVRRCSGGVYSKPIPNPCKPRQTEGRG